MKSLNLNCEQTKVDTGTFQQISKFQLIINRYQFFKKHFSENRYGQLSIKRGFGLEIKNGYKTGNV